MDDHGASTTSKQTLITPSLAVRNGAQAVAFYQQAFGADELFRVDSDDGAVVAQLAVNGAAFWIADEAPQAGNFSPKTLGGSTVRLLLIVDDPDAVFTRAVAAGATVVWPVADQDYGWRVGHVVDPFGHQWEIGTPL